MEAIFDADEQAWLLSWRDLRLHIRLLDGTLLPITLAQRSSKDRQSLRCPARSYSMR